MWRLLRAELATLTRHLTDTLRPGYSVTSWGSARRRSGGSSGLKRRRTRWSGSQAWDDVISAANTAHIMAAKSWTLCLLWATIVHRRTDAIYRTSSMKQWTERHQVGPNYDQGVQILMEMSLTSTVLLLEDP